MFALPPQLYPQDLVDFHNYFRLLDDVFHKWLENLDIEPFHNMINNLDPDLKFTLENPSKSLNFLDINQSFNYLTYTSCYPPHTKKNIPLSLAKRIVSIVCNNKEDRLKELKEHLLDRKHPQHIIDYSFTKIFLPKFQTQKTIMLHLSTPTIILISKNSIDALRELKAEDSKPAFEKKVLLSTKKQPPNF